MRRIALTGGIATGKSHVRAEFARLGIPTIDADVVARQVVAPGTSALQAIVERFGPGVLDSTAALERRRLAAIVFNDAEARRDLEAIVHPAVRAATDAWFASLDASRHPIAIADIPLLYETGREQDFDLVIVTACEPATQLHRVMSRDRLSEDEARKRLAAQLPTEDKARRADVVIRTDGSIEDTNRQVRDVAAQLGAGGRDNAGGRTSGG
jgi:dephospho-CoA kinase